LTRICIRIAAALLAAAGALAVFPQAQASEAVPPPRTAHATGTTNGPNHWTVDLTATLTQTRSSAADATALCTATVRSTTVGRTEARCWVVNRATKGTRVVPSVSTFGNVGVAQGSVPLSFATNYDICVTTIVNYAASPDIFCAPLA
jgi:hypothetical protein